MAIETTGTRDEAGLQQLAEEHRRYAEKLDGLSSHPYLSEDEYMEQSRLKKLKLKVKDEMAGRRLVYDLN